MNSPARQPKVFFPNLDGLRTIACLLVFGFHGLISILPAHSVHVHGSSVLLYGMMGVNFFFVLSGFLITYLLLDEEQRTHTIDLLGFYRRRVLRIWPLFYLCVAYGFLVLPLLMHWLRVPYYEKASGWLHLAFLGNLDSVWQGVQPTAHSLAVLWSVAIEEQFYLVWPVLLMFVFRQWRPGAFLLVIVASVGFRYAHSTNGFLLYRHSLAVMSDMAMGGAAAWACFHYPALQRHIAGWSRWTIAGLYLLGAACIVLGERNVLPETATLLAVKRVAYAFVFVFIILEQNYAVHSWFKLKNNRWLTYWGTFTYGFYCLHPIVLEWLVLGSEQLHLAPSALNTIVRATVALPLSAGLAWLSYTYWEKPFLRLKNRHQPTEATIAATQAPASLPVSPMLAES